MRVIRSIILVMGSLLSILSCGGGDGSAEGVNSASDTNSNPSSNNATVFSRQSALPGKLSFDQSQRGWTMSLSDGTYVSINAAPWTYPNPFGAPAAMTVPRGQNSEFVVSSLGGDCLRFDEYPRREEFCIDVYSFSNEKRLSFWLPGNLNSPVLLSNDGMYFLFEYDLNRANVIQIGTRNLDAVTLTERDDIVDFDWLPDNRILMATDREIIITNTISFEVQQTIQPQSAGIRGDICSIYPNRDGTRLLVNIKNNNLREVDGCVPWILDLSDNSYYQLATTQDESSLRFGSMDWSPDGNWIFFQNGISAGTQLVNTSSRGYVVPTNKRDTPFVVSTLEQERSEEVIPIYRHQIIGGTGADSYPIYSNPSHEGFNSSVFWID